MGSSRGAYFDEATVFGGTGGSRHQNQPEITNAVLAEIIVAGVEALLAGAEKDLPMQEPPPKAALESIERQTVELPQIYASKGLEFVALEPTLFACIRQCSSITSASIVADISAGGRGLKRIPTPAKGHADFFLTEAGGFLIKSIKPGELKLLANILPAYYQHLAGLGGANSLLNRMCCMFAITSPVYPNEPASEANAHSETIQELPTSRARVFLVLESVWPSSAAPRIAERFDFKGHRGSSRKTPAAKIRQMKNSVGHVTLWDLDWPIERVITTTAARRHAIVAAIERDLKWLQSAEVMDYSLMVGIEGPPVAQERESTASAEFNGVEGLGRHSLVDLVDGRRYHFGLIDLLQRWHAGKQVEGWFKGLLKKKDEEISSVEPGRYRERMETWVSHLFAVTDTSTEADKAFTTPEPEPECSRSEL